MVKIYISLGSVKEWTDYELLFISSAVFIESFVIPSILMFLRKLQANVSNQAVTLLLIDWYQYHTLLLFAVSDRKSRVTHSAVRTYRIISSVSLLILRVLYPRAPSRPSVSPCPIGRTSTSTSLMPQLVQAVIPPRRDASVGLKRFGEFKAPVGLWSLSPWNEKARF